MDGLARRTPAVTILRGPLVLAKGRVAGTSRADYWSVSCTDDPENWFSLWF